MEIIPVDYDLSSVINDLVNMIQTRADEKGLVLSLDFDKGIPNAAAKMHALDGFVRSTQYIYTQKEQTKYSEFINEDK